MDNYFKVKNWDNFQHYKDRNPPWIKLHNHLLDNYEFECLPDASKAHLLCIWMLASRTQNKMPMDSKWIKRKIGASEDVDLQILVKYGFIECECEIQSMAQDASTMLVSEEERRGEAETEESREDPLSGKPDVRIVIDHFNLVTGQKLKVATKSHSENISGRLSDGYTVEDLKMVIDFKNYEWSNDPKMAQYIRPATLFQTGKFGGYLAAAKTAPKVKTSSLHNLSGITYQSEDL